MTTAPPTTSTPTRGGVVTLWLYLATAVIWGSSFLFMKVALRGVSPGQLVLGRLTMGAMTLVLLMTLTRRAWPRSAKLWGHLAAVAVFLCVVPFLLYAYAGELLPSGLSSILNATTPIMTLLVGAVALPAERLTPIRGLGVLLGAAGVVLIGGPWRLAHAGASISLTGILACLGATLCYGIGYTYLRRFVVGKHPYDAVSVSAVQILLGAVMMLALAPFTALGAPTLDLPVVASIVALGALGTGMAYVWNMRVVTDWGAVAASTVTYLTPLVGVVLGVLVLGEHLDWNEPVGGLVVLLGVIIGQGGLSALRRR